jgi:hypothetical protein
MVYRSAYDLNTNAGGVVTNYLAVSPRVIGDNWGDYSGLYDSYQVVAFTATFFPSQGGTDRATGTIPPIFVTGVDRNSGANPASAAEVMNKEGWVAFTLYDNKPKSVTWRIMPEERSTWTAIGSDQAGSIQIYADSGGASIEVAQYVTRWWVLFKGHS